MRKVSITDLLKEPFDPKVVHWRPGKVTQDKTKCIALAYINARDAMKRLDDVCGDGWQCEYPFEGCCRIGIKIDGEWMWRSNGAGETDIEGEKGQYSDAFKRAAVMWGVGRYLYYLPNVWVDMDQYKKIVNPPSLPDWAVPGFKRGAYSEVINRNIDAVRVLQEGINERESDIGKLLEGVEAWLDIPQEDQTIIYGVSPSANGILTTEQRTFMHSTEFTNATRQVMGIRK
jgi:hypothetical protein